MYFAVRELDGHSGLIAFYLYCDLDTPKRKRRGRGKRRRAPGATQGEPNLAAQPPAAVPSAPPPSTQRKETSSPQANKSTDVTSGTLDTAMYQSPPRRPTSTPKPTPVKRLTLPTAPVESAMDTVVATAAKRKAVTPPDDHPAKSKPPVPTIPPPAEEDVDPWELALGKLKRQFRDYVQGDTTDTKKLRGRYSNQN
ncbi:lysine-rich arabinogalactan protein 19-like [Gigantopelta aegis]|uniref:lysine-rich arabinogalactan protein 19-like n=1 Tax=Gigantopelta aegis TaxID=1735272 RepID=UPI001B88CB83|nr:lysine-rich arabinogalactan protein 19-like [Gigantopelta aegis]